MDQRQIAPAADRTRGSALAEIEGVQEYGSSSFSAFVNGLQKKRPAHGRPFKSLWNISF